ncbi:MAG: alpha-amylase family glycosyl hydrolase, partial [Bacilli bacterium]
MEALWKKAIIYQIYPKSFNDDNNDGLGDLQGIIKKIPYLKDLGIDYIWITPIYVSPMNDNGYDIADYYNIDKSFGTMADFDELVLRLHENGLKLMMDIVVNHTSTEHEWFKQACLSVNNPYHDYYIWTKNPNNWVSKFGGSSWQYHEQCDEYYLHLF